VKPRLIVVGPLPPPYHGVTVSTQLLLDNELLRERFVVEHLDSSDHRAEPNVGRWDLTNVRLGLGNLATLYGRLGSRRGLVYLPLSQNTPAFLRDSLFIHLSATRGWKVVAHLRGSDFKAFYETRPGPLRRWIRRTLGRLDSVAVMGGSLRWIFEGLIPEDRIAVVPNGTPDPRVNGVARDGQTVVFLSNLRRRKGVVQAIDTALLVLRELPSTRFVFVGEWESPELEVLLRARAEPAGTGIEFRRPVAGDEKDELLASSSILLFPPVEPEGHPRVVLEAQAAGLPVVTTDRGAIAETVVDDRTGYVLAQADPEELADRILRLLRDKELRLRMSEAARDRYLEHFTQDLADRSLADWLTTVASGGRR
jgi:glycosyltransferase involved in cell wall biosynthesis